MKFAQPLNPLVLLIVIGTFISSIVVYGLNGIIMAVVVAIVMGLIDGVRIVRTTPRKRYKRHGME